MRVAEFEDGDDWPRRWAEEYVARARDEVGGWLKRHGVRFFPVVNWAERGVYGDGNSVPRFHLTWGCGQALIDEVWGAIERHPAPLAARGPVPHPGHRAASRDREPVTGCRVVAEDDDGAEPDRASAPSRS